MNIQFMVGYDLDHSKEDRSRAEAWMTSLLYHLPLQANEAAWRCLAAFTMLLRGTPPSAQETEEGRVWLKIKVPGIRKPFRYRLWVA